MQSQPAVFHSLFAFVNSWLLFPVQCHKFTNEPLHTATFLRSPSLCRLCEKNPLATNARIGFSAYRECPLLPFFSVLCPFAVFARENSHQCTNSIPYPLPLPTATFLRSQHLCSLCVKFSAIFAPLWSLRETNFPPHLPLGYLCELSILKLIQNKIWMVFAKRITLCLI